MPTVKIDPIEVSSTPGGFLAAARELQTSADWSGGVTFSPNCGGASNWRCDYSGAEKNIDEIGDPIEFLSFLIYAGVRCSGAPVVDDLYRHAGDRLKRDRSGALARELHDSANGNPSLQSDAIDITGGATLCIEQAIAALLSTAADCGGGELFIHVPFVGLATLFKLNMVVYENGKYTIGGHTIVVDDYPNLGPGGAPALDTQVWLYATGPVEYKLAAEFDVTHYTERQNDSVAIAEQLAVVRFDPCCAYAVIADICCTC